MVLHLVNADPKYTPPHFQPPPAGGWLHVGAAIAPPGRLPFVRPNAARAALIERLNELAERIRPLSGVRHADIFRAVLIPPADPRHANLARFDVAVLVETASVETADAVLDHPTFATVLAALDAVSSHVHVMAARCTRQVAPVDHTPAGLFLFNYFAPTTGQTDTETATQLWEHLAAWYITETGLANSTLLAPTGPSDFVLVNHARFDRGLPSLAAKQFRKPTFRSYVQANLGAHDLIAMPALYRLATSPKENRDD